MAGFVCPQMESVFFGIPTEIRHAIYQHLIPNPLHVSYPNGRFHLSPCVKHPLDHLAYGMDPGYGSDPPLDLDEPVEFIPWDRERSSWGPHWRCKELATQKGVPGGPSKHIPGIVSCV
ncbi:hypothetical protein BCR34DRAFT_22648 [Clohesyomyces aquaticus]|uniref:Uncharacterized protein n=1 Tax=Clohesyomyces aquaticus TaxID=1231657 RepID=A0A1Y2A540_9PLEO|nr:hypothetical protein BCR34DRAFT_22648 [Clohesyomyces aquaticus]